MDTTEIQERFLVVSHTQTERPFRIVGSAYKKKKENFYILFLRMLPGIPYYITPHRDRPWEFVIFSGRTESGRNDGRFFCKIGSGVYISKTNTIQLHLPDLRQVYYMKLCPQDFHFDARSDQAV